MMNIEINNPRAQLVCGLVMPISAMGEYPKEHWVEVHDILSECIASISEFSFDVKLVSDADDVGVIQRTIVQNLYKSDIVICDVSGKNPNVMFELGMRLAFDKPTVIIKDDITDYTFDTGIIEHLSYPHDLRFSRIKTFTVSLREKIIATYKASKNNPEYSIFLKNFGDFVTPSMVGSIEQEATLSSILTLVQALHQHQIKAIHEHAPTVTLPATPSYKISRASIERGDFVSHYQPIFDIAGNLVGIESLVRKKLKDSRVELPHTFLPEMIESGLIIDLGRWIINTAIQDFTNWTKEGFIVPKICINLSHGELFHENIYSELERLSTATNGKLEVEIGEESLIFDPEKSLEQIARLKNLGLTVTIDNFGTGYSSLTQIKRFPIDCLKIDRSFIRGIDSNAGDSAITQAIVAMAHTLNLKVIAIGVENEVQAAMLKSINCHEVQGFLFGKPVSASEIKKFFHNKKS